MCFLSADAALTAVFAVAFIFAAAPAAKIVISGRADDEHQLRCIIPLNVFRLIQNTKAN